MSERTYRAIVDDVARWCRQGRTVLVSSEDFSGLLVPQWAPLLQLCAQVPRQRLLKRVRRSSRRRWRGTNSTNAALLNFLDTLFFYATF